MGVGMCLYAQLVQPKNKQCESARRSRQREQLHATVVSTCSSVCRQIAKTRYSQHINLEFMTTYKKSHMGFSKNPFLFT